MIHFDTPETERAYLLDLHSFYTTQSEAIMQKPSFCKQDIEKYQSISALADSAKELAELIREEQNKQ